MVILLHSASQALMLTTLFDIVLWPTTLTYIPSLAKVNVNFQTKNQGQRSQRLNRRAQIYKETNRQLDWQHCNVHHCGSWCTWSCACRHVHYLISTRSVRFLHVLCEPKKWIFIDQYLIRSCIFTNHIEVNRFCSVVYYVISPWYMDNNNCVNWPQFVWEDP